MFPEAEGTGGRETGEGDEGSIREKASSVPLGGEARTDMLCYEAECTGLEPSGGMERRGQTTPRGHRGHESAWVAVEEDDVSGGGG